MSRSILLALAALSFVSSTALAQQIRSDLYATNGRVYALVADGNTLYLGGDFTIVGRPVGSGVPFDASTGLPPSSFAPVASGGGVKAVAADGSGGWFVGGDFGFVGGIPHNRLAHILADGTVSSWTPDPSYTIDALKRVGSTLYVGGEFTTIAGQSRHGIAAFDIPTETLTSWNPSFGGNGIAIDVSGSTVYVGGGTTVAAFDATTGSSTGWSASASGGMFPSVNAILVQGSIVYVGGRFGSIGFQFRNNLAALDATTGAATAWNPNPDNGVSTLALNGSTLLVGGSFTNIGGQSRLRIAAVDVTTGNATGWNPSAGGTSGQTFVSSIVVDGSMAWVGGSFTSIGGQSRGNIASIDLANSAASSWNPNLDREVYAIGRSGSTVFAGGFFNLMSVVPRSRLAALDLTTGQATSFNPGVDGPVYGLAKIGTTLYVGGSFALLSGQPRNRLGAVDVTTGNATAFAATTNSQVNLLVAGGSTVYAAGSFTGIGGFARNYVAALDATTGAVNPTWNPNSSASSSVLTVAVDGSTVYIGGAFSTMGGQSRNNVAAVDAVTGAATAWNPGAGGVVYSLLVSGSTVYVGGQFTFAGGQPRNSIAAVSASTGNATSWNPGVAGIVSELALDGTSLYLGGDFGTVGGLPRAKLAAVDVNTGATTSWDPAVYVGGIPSVDGLVVGSSTVCVGGNFQALDGLPNINLAGVTETTVGVPPPGPTAGSWATLSSRPNPFKRTTDLEFSIARDTHVTISIHDVAGREVARVADRTFPAGVHHARFDAGRLSSGVYLCTLRAGGRALTRRIVLIP